MSRRISLGLGFLIGIASGQGFIQKSPDELVSWVRRIYFDQIKLLKIEWGNPGFCTEWDRDYDAQTKSCGRRRKFIKRYMRTN